MLPIPSVSQVASTASLHLNHSIATIPRRWWRSLLGGLVAICFVGYFFLPVTPSVARSPPLYETYHRDAIQLSQQNYDMTDNPSSSKYIWIANQCSGQLDIFSIILDTLTDFPSLSATGVGWGNFLQEYLLDAYIAHEAGWR